MSAAVNTGIGGSSKYLISATIGQGDDDFVDRCSHTFTTLILLIFTLLISCRQYMGKPISCWVPTEFTRAQEEYAENVCWVTSTYFLPSDIHNVPISPLERDKSSLGYYQWVPFLLMLQALMFNIPCIVWKLFNWQSGIQLSNIMQVATETSLAREIPERQHHLSYLAHYIQDNLHSSNAGKAGCFSSGSNSNSFREKAQRIKAMLWRNVCCLLLHRRYGNYLIALYLLVKFLYLANVCGQLLLLNRFVHTNYSMYGLGILYDLYNGRTWAESGHFPRVTLCDFEIRKLANTHRYTVQCVLPINMFNEKIFIFLWFWYGLLLILTVHSCLKWSYRFAWTGARHSFVRHFLLLKGLLSPQDRSSVKVFTEKFVRPDGAFILHLIDANVGELTAADVTENLWFAFKHHSILSDPAATVAMDNALNPTNYPLTTISATSPLASGGGGGGGGVGGGGGGAAVTSHLPTFMTNKLSPRHMTTIHRGQRQTNGDSPPTNAEEDVGEMV